MAVCQMVAADTSMRCARCLKYGHTNQDCPLPFLRTHTVAELRQQRYAAQQKWEKEKAERDVKREEERKAYEERQAKRAERDAQQSEKSKSQSSRAPSEAVPLKSVARPRWCDLSEVSDETESTAAASTAWDQDEVKRMASQDKEVRKFEKQLRAIEKLEREPYEKLQVTQRKKLEKKADVAVLLDTARGLAESRARDTLKKTIASFA